MRPDLANLISRQDGLKKVLEAWCPVAERESIAISEAKGRVLAETVSAGYNVPMVRASMMDGIAVKSADFAQGMPDTERWVRGRDYERADTGDDFDDAYDSVIAIEEVTFLEGGGLKLSDRVDMRPGLNVKPQGRDIKAGTIALEPGRVLSLTDVTAAAMCGYSRLEVLRKIRIGFVPTGSELVPVTEELKRGQHFDTNSLMVKMLTEEYGGEFIAHDIVRDQKSQIRDVLFDMLEKSDLLILNAGTSKGEEDFCHRVLEEEGQILFSGVAAVPGRPMTVAMVQGKPVINMSGPSFAAFYSMEWMVKALVGHYYGSSVPERPRVMAKLTEDITAPPIFDMLMRMQIWQLEDGSYEARPLAMKGPKAAGDLRLMTANGVCHLAKGEKHQAGELVQVEFTS